MYPRANGVYPSVYPLPPLDGCVLNLDMQDTGSKLIDQSGRSNHGTNNGSTPRAGNYGCVRSFDGVDDYIVSPNVITTYPFTLEAWVKTNNATLEQYFCIINQSNSAISQYGIRFLSGRCNIVARNTTPFGTAGTTTVVNNTWYHVTGIFESATSRILYVNGQQEATGADSVLFNNNANNQVLVGVLRTMSPAAFLNGIVGMSRVWKKSLSASEIKQLFQAEAWKYGIAY